MGKQSLRDVGRSHMSKDQQVMAREMSQPKSLASVMDQVVGRSKADPAVEALALQIIETGPDLRLGMREWRAVQDLVEAGIVAGMAKAGPTPR
ncbi:hypothetical protein SEA_NUCCI_63 [Microbacterium phage Nucci]|nr:hypothetical protein SEA_NUCCI_63 [Microbacterium phage Nucci]